MKIFKDRITEYNNRYKETLVEKLSDTQSVITLEKVEGKILQEGNLFKSEDMNRYEQLADSISNKYQDETFTTTQDLERDKLVLVKDNTVYPTYSYFSEVSFVDKKEITKRVLSSIADSKIEIYSTNDGLYFRELSDNVVIGGTEVLINSGSYLDFIVLSNDDKNIYLLATDGTNLQAFVLTTTTSTLINITEVSNVKKIKNDGLLTLLQTDTDTIYTVFSISENNNVVVNSTLPLNFLSTSCFNLVKVSDTKTFITYDNNYLVINNNTPETAQIFTEKTIKNIDLSLYNTSSVVCVFSCESGTFLAEFSLLSDTVTYQKESKIDNTSNEVRIFNFEKNIISFVTDGEFLKFFISTNEYSGLKTIKNYIKIHNNEKVTVLNFNDYMIYLSFSSGENNYFLKFIRSVESDNSNFSKIAKAERLTAGSSNVVYTDKVDDTYIQFFYDDNTAGTDSCLNFCTFVVSNNEISMNNTTRYEAEPPTYTIKQISYRNFLFMKTTNDKITIDLKYLTGNTFNHKNQSVSDLPDGYVIKNNNFNRVEKIDDVTFVITTLVTDGTDNYLMLKYYEIKDDVVNCMYTNLIEKETNDSPALFDIYFLSGDTFAIFKNNTVTLMNYQKTTFSLIDTQIYHTNESNNQVLKLSDGDFLTYNSYKHSVYSQGSFTFVRVSDTDIEIKEEILMSDVLVGILCELSENYVAATVSSGKIIFLSVDVSNNYIYVDKELKNTRTVTRMYKENENALMLLGNSLDFTFLHDIDNTIYDRIYGITKTKTYYDSVNSIKRIRVKNNIRVKT